MKTFITFMVLICIASIAAAQNSTIETATEPKGYDPRKYQNEGTPAQVPTNFVQHNPMTQVVQSTGKQFSGDEMVKMARRDVNGIASTVAGVNSRPGTNETPSIRGADQSGTAYFVDGVRVYGSLPFLTK